jgi:hypothetical protein
MPSDTISREQCLSKSALSEGAKQILKTLWNKFEIRVRLPKFKGQLVSYGTRKNTITTSDKETYDELKQLGMLYKLPNNIAHVTYVDYVIWWAKLYTRSEC